VSAQGMPATTTHHHTPMLICNNANGIPWHIAILFPLRDVYSVKHAHFQHQFLGNAGRGVAEQLLEVLCHCHLDAPSTSGRRLSSQPQHTTRRAVLDLQKRGPMRVYNAGWGAEGAGGWIQPLLGPSRQQQQHTFSIKGADTSMRRAGSVMCPYCADTTTVDWRSGNAGRCPRRSADASICLPQTWQKTYASCTATLGYLVHHRHTNMV